MTVLVALAAAMGLLLVFDGCTAVRSRHKSVIGTGLVRLATDSGVPGLTGPRLVAMATAAGVLTLVLVAGVTGSLVVAVATSAIACSWPFAFARGRAARRAKRMSEEWPDAIANLVAAIRAGISLPEACVGLAARSGDEIKPGIEAFTMTYRSSGSFSTALERMRAVLADATADRVVVALDLAHSVGGTDLVRVLRTLGDFVREDLRVRKEIEARWSWTVTAARVAAAAPWVVLVLMSSRPEAALAYSSPSGAMVILGGGAATFIGYRAMLRIARLPVERRLGS